MLSIIQTNIFVICTLFFMRDTVGKVAKVAFSLVSNRETKGTKELTGRLAYWAENYYNKVVQG